LLAFSLASAPNPDPGSRGKPMLDESSAGGYRRLAYLDHIAARERACKLAGGRAEMGQER